MRWQEIIEAARAPVGSTFTVYHGTETKYRSFNDKHRGSANGNAPINRTGFNFTDNIEVARTFGPIILVCEVTILKPLVINARGRNYSQFKHDLNDKLHDADKSKYDGVIIKNYADAGVHGDDYIVSNHYIPFYTTNVKLKSRTK
jgi:hypothetical protein